MFRDLPSRPLAASLTALALLALAFAAPSRAAERPAFYEAPAVLPDGGPGTLVRSEPFGLNGITRPPAGTRAWRLLYTSTGATGDRTVVSGSLLLPAAGGAAVKGLVSVGVGTHGMGDQCAVSRQLATGAEPDLATMTNLLRRGYAVAVTDYQGLGTAGQHVFAVNKALGRNMLDVIRAARQVPGTGLATDDQVGLVGYSEGGGAAGSAAEQAATYAPELRVVGTVAGGTLSNPERAVRPLEGNWFMGLKVAGAIGYDQAYPELGLDRYLTAAGKHVVRNDTRGCQEFVARFMFNRMSWYTKSDPVTKPDWKARMRENAVGAVKPSAPVYLYHGRFDEAVFYDQTERVKKSWCALGATVRWRLNPITEHFTTQYVEEPNALRWLEGRFAGSPAPTTC